jgi:glycerophosphoryl diester phosphodiesterase
MLSGDGLRRIADYARGLGAEKSLIIPRDAASNLAPPTDLVARAHAANLVVHPWTFRPENYFLPTAMRVGATGAQETLRLHGNLDAELRAFFAAGVDGVFSDDPAAAVAAHP